MASKLNRLICRLLPVFASDRRGTAMVTFAIVLPSVLGLTGLGTEVGVWYKTKRSLQTAVDAAAVAGTLERSMGKKSSVTTAAVREAARNGYPATSATLVVNSPPKSGPQAGNPAAVETIISQPQKLFLSALFLDNGITVAARAVGVVTVEGSACVLALNRTAAIGANVQGSTTVNMAGCVVAANSSSTTAINISGSGALDAESLWTAGNYYYGGSASLSLEKPAVTNAWALPDPYADLTIPTPTTCNQNNFSASGTQTLSPGVYCNGLAFGSHSNATLRPGIYYVNKGDFTVSATAVVRCSCTAPGDGVTIVMTSSDTASSIGSATINGGADIILNAPGSDDAAYKGLVFVQDPRAPTNHNNKFNGGALQQLNGAIYSPAEQVQWAGNNSASGPTCTEIIADTVTFIGNSLINNTGCPAAGVKPVHITGVALVE